MENRLANSAWKLAVQMEQIIPGLDRLGAALNLAPTLLGMVEEEIEALNLSHSEFLEARVRLRKKRRELEPVLKAGRVFATMYRDLRKHELGGKGSREWEAIGFRGTRQVPLKIDQMLLLLGTMGGYLANHPEESFPGVDLTASRAQELQEALAAASHAVNQAKADVHRALQARAVVLARGRRLVRKVFNDLMFAMDPLDGRWVEFGFNQPGLKATPAAPESVTVKTMEPSNMLAVQWPAVPLAESYRVWVRVIGVDAEAKPIGKTSDTTFCMEDAPRGVELEVGVTAMNRRGEGGMSQLIVIRTGAEVLPKEMKDEEQSNNTPT